MWDKKQEKMWQNEKVLERRPRKGYPKGGYPGQLYPTRQIKSI